MFTDWLMLGSTYSVNGIVVKDASLSHLVHTWLVVEKEGATALGFLP